PDAWPAVFAYWKWNLHERPDDVRFDVNVSEIVQRANHLYNLGAPCWGVETGAIKYPDPKLCDLYRADLKRGTIRKRAETEREKIRKAEMIARAERKRLRAIEELAESQRRLEAEKRAEFIADVAKDVAAITPVQKFEDTRIGILEAVV